MGYHRDQFLIYINDLEDDISSKVLKFADDKKVFRKFTNDTDKQSLQDHLDKLVKWSEKWQMLFNFGKCKCIHIGHGNMDEEYKMGDAVLGRTTQEKDLGVTFIADVKVSEQCGIAASKRNQFLGLIRRTIMYKEKQLIVPLWRDSIPVRRPDSQSREPGFKSHRGRFEPLASLITPRCHSSLSCINEYLAIQTVVDI